MEVCKEGKVFANVSAGADRKANTFRVAAHSRLEIIVSFRMAASAEAPVSPMLLYPILQSMGKVGAVRVYRSVNGRGHEDEHLGAGSSKGGLLDGLQCGVAREALRKSGSSFGTEVVLHQTANMGAGGGCCESVNGR